MGHLVVYDLKADSITVSAALLHASAFSHQPFTTPFEFQNFLLRGASSHRAYPWLWPLGAEEDREVAKASANERWKHRDPMSILLHFQIHNCCISADAGRAKTGSQSLSLEAKILCASGENLSMSVTCKATGSMASLGGTRKLLTSSGCPDRA